MRITLQRVRDRGGEWKQGGGGGGEGRRATSEAPSELAVGEELPGGEGAPVDALRDADGRVPDPVRHLREALRDLLPQEPKPAHPAAAPLAAGALLPLGAATLVVALLIGRRRTLRYCPAPLVVPLLLPHVCAPSSRAAIAPQQLRDAAAAVAVGSLVVAAVC